MMPMIHLVGLAKASNQTRLSCSKSAEAAQRIGLSY